MKNSPTRQCFIGVLFAHTLISSARAETATLKPFEDTAAYEYFSTFNLGGMSFVPVGSIPKGGRSRGLFRFDLSSIPSNANVSSVSLQVNIVRAGILAQSANNDLHRVLQPWGEGNKSGQAAGFGAPATDGEATWNSRAVPANWGAPGGLVGTDFVSTISSTALLGNAGPFSFESAPVMVADVQLWINTPSANFGWMIICRDETLPNIRWIGSKEDPTNAAALVVNYTLPVPPPGISNNSPLGGGIYAMPYSQTLLATGGTPGFTWSVVAGSLPGGLSLAPSSGALGGTPVAAGTFNFTARVTDSVGVNTDKPFSIIISPLVPPTIANVLQNGARFIFSFNGTAGQSYGIEFRDRFTSTNLWSPLTNLGILPGSGMLSITNAISGTQRFYRVRTP